MSLMRSLRTHFDIALQNIGMCPFHDIAPPNAYIIYDMNGGKYFVTYKDYSGFVNSYLTGPLPSMPHSLTMDLNVALSHIICLDIDIRHTLGGMDPSLFVESYVREILIPKVKNVFDNGGFDHFTLILAKGRTGGLHVYLPEFYIYNDDYEYLCEYVLSELSIATESIAFRLDTPTNFNLSYASKPECPPYEPYQVVYVETRTDTTIVIGMDELEHDFKRAKSAFKKKSWNTGSFFRVLLNSSFIGAQTFIRRAMMPVLNDCTFTSQKVSFNTVITAQVDERCEEVAVLGLVQGDEVSKKYVYKRGHLLKKDGKQMYNYLNLHSLHINHLNSRIVAIKRWLKRFEKQKVQIKADCFADLNRKLKQQNSILRDMESPLREILVYRDGFYFVPVFYALCKYFDIDSVELCLRLQSLVDGETHKWQRKMSDIDPSVIATASKDFTYHTILYCSTNMHEPTDSLDKKIEFVLFSVEAEIDQSIDQNQVCQIIVNVMKLYFPARSSMKKRCMWNPVKNQWQDCSDSEYRHMINTLFVHLKNFWEKKFDGENFPVKPDIVAVINCLVCANDFIAQAEMTADDRKWILRTQEGVLDLLTGHVGGIVPEHFLSTKVMLPAVPVVSKLINDELLIEVFKKLWEETFLEKYLEKLKAKENADYLMSLKTALTEENVSLRKSVASDSLLVFYVDLCKYLRFNYEEMKFFATTLATNLTATNYGKYVFILQGEANNGKSRLLNTMQNAFAQYAAAISSSTLTHMRTKGNLQPDIALNVFSCRIMTVEELAGPIDENYIKILTGNSSVSARALYENNRTGIPTAKLWASTNKTPPCTATTAFCDRILPFPFSAKFVEEAPEIARDQIEVGMFKPSRDESSMKSSTLGMFLHSYFFHSQEFSRADGLLAYPPIPESIREFRKEYLKITDVYSQFKSFADIQEIPGEYVTIHDLRSAIRQFLTYTRLNRRYMDEEIINRFNEEYRSKIFYSDDVLSDEESENSDSDDDADEIVGETAQGEGTLDEETNSRKKPRLDETADKTQNEIMNETRNEGTLKRKLSEESNSQKKQRLSYECYRDIIIKNLKKKS
jgi:hypothetical protein